MTPTDPAPSIPSGTVTGGSGPELTRRAAAPLTAALRRG